VAELWRLVWPDTTRERFAEILPRHARRDGFRFVAAREADGALAGIAYGYIGGPGQWWHDIVAAALDPERAARWLAPGHFELVELMVHPGLHGRGIGGRLHDALLAGVEASTAVLSTEVDNRPALRLYASRGWQVVVPELRFSPDGPRYLVLGLELAGPRRSFREPAVQ
jgi:ribosomal protein S18 acetylase RimI-like enzyme